MMAIQLDKLDIPFRNRVQLLLQFVDFIDELLKNLCPLCIIHLVFMLFPLVFVKQSIVLSLPVHAFLLHHLIIFLPFINFRVYNIQVTF